MSRALREAVRELRIALRILNAAVAAAAGLRPRDLDVLDVIDREGPVSPSWVSDRTGYRRATLTEMLGRLERDGWVVRTPDPRDGRSARLASTGRFDELRALYAPIDAAADRFAESRSEQECADLAAAITELAAAIRER